MDTEMACYESFAEVTEDFYCSAVDVLKILVLRLHDYHARCFHSLRDALYNYFSTDELRNYAIDACTKKRPGFSERVCIDTFNSARKERAAYTGTVQIRKGLGFPNKHFATQNLHLCARMHCLPQWCWF